MHKLGYRTRLSHCAGFSLDTGQERWDTRGTSLAKEMTMRSILVRGLLVICWVTFTVVSAHSVAAQTRGNEASTPGSSAHDCVERSVLGSTVFSSFRHYQITGRNTCKRAIDVYMCAWSSPGWSCALQGIQGTDGSGTNHDGLADTFVCRDSGCAEWGRFTWNAVYQDSGEQVAKPDVDNSTQHRTK